MRAHLLSELASFFSEEQCRYCEAVERPSTLTMHSYSHPNGVGVIQPDGGVAPRWVYGTCETCQYQWSYHRLSGGVS